jgi:hypothetical protein
MTVTLNRTEITPDGTFGQMVIPSSAQLMDLRLYTMEDDWLFNRRGVSSIPEGDYVLVRTIFLKHLIETFEVTGVPGRSRILIHVANTEEDVEGCIGVGFARGYLTVPDEDSPLIPKPRVRKRAVLDSKDAFRQFMYWMRGQDHVPFAVRWGPGVNPNSRSIV